jgi:SAM-dependent methyltransferase
MSVVEETTLGRLGRRARHGLRVLTTPALWREQVAYFRHGPSPSAAPAPTVSFPASPWRPVPSDAAAYCNICGWEGVSFDGPRHVEFQLCPRCGSSGRDRFSFLCFVSRTPATRWLRVIETSPRLGAAYRAAMAQWFTYTATDYDESSHRGTVRLDLQDIDLPPSSVDVLLTAHVLEHVPDTDRALTGITRTLAPGGRMYLQVPVQEGATIEPPAPEYHQDNTKVFWRFGFDLADRLRRHGFRTTVLVTAPMVEAVRTGDPSELGGEGSEWDVPAILAAAKDAGLQSVLDQRDAERLGLWESYQYATFECVLPGRSALDEITIRIRRAGRRIR